MLLVRLRFCVFYLQSGSGLPDNQNFSLSFLVQPTKADQVILRKVPVRYGVLLMNLEQNTKNSQCSNSVQKPILSNLHKWLCLTFTTPWEESSLLS